MQQRAVALLMVLFDRADKTEFLRKLAEALFLGGFGEALVHIRPLVVFALGGVQKILRRIADAVELLEPELRMLLFVVRGFQEESGDLLIALLLCFAGEKRILVAGFRFPGECGAEVLLGLCPGILVLFRHFFYSFIKRIFRFVVCPDIAKEPPKGSSLADFFIPLFSAREAPRQCAQRSARYSAQAARSFQSSRRRSAP